MIGDCRSERLWRIWDINRLLLIVFFIYLVVQGEAKRNKVAAFQQSLENEPRFQTYLSAVKDMNNARVNQLPFNAFQAFKSAAEKNGTDNQNGMIGSWWSLLAKMLGFNRISDGELPQGVFKQIYSKVRAGESDNETVEFKMKLIHGSREWLQEIFRDTVARIVRDNHSELEGRPSPHKEVDAFIKLMFFSNGRWKVGWLDHGIGKTPFWAHLYYLVRMGLLRESLDYLEKHAKDLKSSRDANFYNYFKAWCNSPDGRLSKSVRDSLLGEWNARIRDYVVNSQSDPKGDPFKYTLYKIIGRCELNIKTIRCNSIVKTTEDYIWMQTMLISEQNSQLDNKFERYTIADFGASIDSFGRAHFSKIETWVTVLYCSGRFEKAINELFNEPSFVADAIHFAIALAYYGVLKGSESPKDIPTTSSLLSTSKIKLGNLDFEQYLFHFGRMIGQITREWALTPAADLMHYVYLNSIFGKPLKSQKNSNPDDKKDENSKLYTMFGINLAKEILLRSELYSELIGKLRSDGSSREHGQIEKYRQLLNLTSEQEYLDKIVLSLAEECEKEGRLNEAIELYNLSGQPNKVLQLLIREIGDYLISDDSGSYRRIITDPVETAQNVMRFYQSRSLEASTLNQRTISTCNTLVTLAQFKKCVSVGNLEAALKKFKDLDLVPFSNDIIEIQKKVNSFNSLDPTVCRVLPTLIVSLAQVLSQLYHQTYKTSITERDHRLKELKSYMRSILTFCGLTQYQIPSEMFAKMNRLDVMMT